MMNCTRIWKRIMCFTDSKSQPWYPLSFQHTRKRKPDQKSALKIFTLDLLRLIGLNTKFLGIRVSMMKAFRKGFLAIVTAFYIIYLTLANTYSNQNSSRKMMK